MPSCVQREHTRSRSKHRNPNRHLGHLKGICVQYSYILAFRILIWRSAVEMKCGETDRWMDRGVDTINPHPSYTSNIRKWKRWPRFLASFSQACPPRRHDCHMSRKTGLWYFAVTSFVNWFEMNRWSAKVQRHNQSQCTWHASNLGLQDSITTQAEAQAKRTDWLDKGQSWHQLRLKLGKR